MITTAELASMSETKLRVGSLTHASLITAHRHAYSARHKGEWAIFHRVSGATVVEKKGENSFSNPNKRLCASRLKSGQKSATAEILRSLTFILRKIYVCLPEIFENYAKIFPQLKQI